MRLLALDIGNTRTVAAVVQDGRVVARYVPSMGAPDPAPESRTAEVFDWAAARVAEAPGVEGIAVSSVVPQVLEIWTPLWRAHARTRRVPELVVRHDIDLPFELDIEHPETLGADRLCNVAGAQALGFHTALVVDLGTANTFDVLEDGIFRGGLIGPGAERAHRALVEGGAQLPPLPFGLPSSLVGRTTEDAIRAGSFHQAVGGVAHVVYRLWDEYPGAAVVLTGGIAELLGPALPFSVLYHPDLTLEGAARLGERMFASG